MNKTFNIFYFRQTGKRKCLVGIEAESLSAKNALGPAAMDASSVDSIIDYNGSGFVLT